MEMLRLEGDFFYLKKKRNQHLDNTENVVTLYHRVNETLNRTVILLCYAVYTLHTYIIVYLTSLSKLQSYTLYPSKFSDPFEFKIVRFVALL